MSTVVMTLALPEATGAPKMAYFFARALLDHGHRVVLAHGPKPTATNGAAENSIVEPMQEIGVETVLVEGLAFPLGSSVPRRVASVATEHEAGCVIGFQQRDRAVALNAANYAGIAGIVSAQNQHSFRGSWPVRRLKRMVYTRAVRRFADLVICPAEAVRDEIVRDFGVRLERTTVVPNGVDVEGFPDFPEDEKHRVRDEFGVREGELMLVSLGRLDTQKGYDVLLRGVRKLLPSAPPFKLIIVGGISSGPTRPRMERHYAELQSYVAEHGLGQHVQFAGWRNDCPLLLRSADVYVHSARWEGWPLAVVEAMSAQRPTVTTDCSGRPQGFDDGTHGYVVPTGDPAALSEAMLKVMQADSATRAAMGYATRALALEHYDVKKLGEQFVKLVEGVQATHGRDATRGVNGRYT